MLYLRWLIVSIIASCVGLGAWVPPWPLVEASRRYGSTGVNWRLLNVTLLLLDKRRSAIDVDRRPHVLN